MITTKIQVEPYIAEYIIGKYYSPDDGAVHFPPSLDIYVTIYDLMARRPASAGADTGNRCFCLPDRREANKKCGGKVIPISDAVSSTCYRTGCTIRLQAKGSQLTAHVETKTAKPTDSSLPHVVDLQATVVPNRQGGIHIQHTGSCGESTTMLHRLQAVWE